MKLQSRELQSRFQREVDRDLYNSWLIPLLNDKAPKGRADAASWGRVRQLLFDLQQLEATRESHKQAVYDHDAQAFALKESKLYLPGDRMRAGLSPYPSDDPKRDELIRTCRGLAERINAQLQRYRWSPEIRFHFNEPVKIRQTWGERTKAYYFENLAVSVLLRELAEGKIDRFRRCGQCGHWFCAVASHQKYCSGNCRTREHSRGVEFRKKRARYMREKYRPFIKRLELQNKPTAAKKKGR